MWLRVLAVWLCVWQCGPVARRAVLSSLLFSANAGESLLKLQVQLKTLDFTRFDECGLKMGPLNQTVPCALRLIDDSNDS